MAVGSGPAARSPSRAGPPRSRACGRRSSRGTGATAARRAGHSKARAARRSPGALGEGARADGGGLAQRVDGWPARVGERTHAREEGVQVGRGALEVREQRRLLVGQVAQALHRRPQLVQEGREATQAARSSSRLPVVISAASPPSSTQRTTSRLLRSSSVITVSESAMKSLITAFWSPRIRMCAEVSRRPGCARRSTSWRSSGARRARCRARSGSAGSAPGRDGG